MKKFGFKLPDKLHVRQWFSDMKEKKQEKHFSTELEALTDRLIFETIGSDGIMTREFEERIAAYDRDRMPIGEQAAKELLVNMLTLAVAQRKLFNSRIEKSVEAGSLFDRYYSKLHTINDLANEANLRRQIMLDAEKRYLYEYGVWKKYRDDTQAIVPDPDYTSDQNKEDVYKVLHSTGGKTVS